MTTPTPPTPFYSRLRGTAPQFIAFILAFVVAVRLFTLGAYPLGGTTEPRYAEIARLMLETGNWVTPWFEPSVPFWGKPPLSFWGSAASMALFGVNEFGARFAPFVASVFTALLFLAWPRPQSRRWTLPLMASVVLFSSVAGFVASGAVMTDMFLTLATTLCMVSFWNSVTDPGGRNPWRWMFFVGLALGMLAKGPVALVITGMAVFLWTWWARAWGVVIKRMPWIRGLLLATALTLPWYLLAEHRTPGFLHYFIVGEHFERFVVSGWAGDKYGQGHPVARGLIWWYAIEVFMPWTLVLFAAAWVMLRRTEEDWRVEDAALPLANADLAAQTSGAGHGRTPGARALPNMAASDAKSQRQGSRGAQANPASQDGERASRGDGRSNNAHSDFGRTMAFEDSQYMADHMADQHGGQDHSFKPIDSRDFSHTLGFGDTQPGELADDIRKDTQPDLLSTEPASLDAAPHKRGRLESWVASAGTKALHGRRDARSQALAQGRAVHEKEGEANGAPDYRAIDGGARDPAKQQARGKRKRSKIENLDSSLDSRPDSSLDSRVDPLRQARFSFGWNPYEFQYLLVWVLAPLLFFTLARNILEAYVLPGLPAFALLTSLAALAAFRRSPWISNLWWLGLVCPLLWLGWLGLSDQPQERSQRALLHHWVPGTPLIYLGSRPLSANFYSNGQAKVASSTDEIRQYLASSDRITVVLQDSIARNLPPEDLLPWHAVAASAGYTMLQRTTPDTLHKVPFNEGK